MVANAPVYARRARGNRRASIPCAGLVCGFLLENLLELDLAFVRGGRFSIWGPARVVFDRSGRVADAANNVLAQGEPESADRAGEAGFAWHDVLHACTAVRRGRPWQGRPSHLICLELTFHALGSIRR